MAEMTLLGAITDAMATEMRSDDRVVVFGEDVGKKGGVFGTTAGIQDEFGGDRCFDTPLSECGIIGAAIGMAVYGPGGWTELSSDITGTGPFTWSYRYTLHEQGWYRFVFSADTGSTPICDIRRICRRIRKSGF